MPKFRAGLPGFLVTIFTLLSGVLTILAIAVQLLPALDDVRYLKDAVDLYIQYIRGPFLRLIGLAGPDDSGGVAGAVADLFLFWIAFFVAVNVFTYKHEGGFLPTHIHNNYCQLRSPGAVSAWACVLPKLLCAFAAAPVVCTIYALSKFTSPKDRLYSAAYLTIQPREVLSYMLSLFGSVALILLAAQYAARFNG